MVVCTTRALKTSTNGIEINDFAVAVARTALWIAEAQMLKETQDIIHRTIDFFPLHTFVNIHEGNALQLNWEDVIAPSELHYIMGNPPFLGARLMSPEQKKDLESIFTKSWKNWGNLEAEIGRTAQAILDARALYPDSSLADLYDTVLMPKELREAHRANDTAVMKAYGFPLSMTEEGSVAALMKLYTELVQA